MVSPSGATAPTAFLPMAFCIEILHAGNWTDDASLLGQGFVDEDNEFQDDTDALDAIDQLVADGFRREDLRVTEID